MAAQVSKPAGGSLGGGLIFVLLLLALIGGDYYTLLHGQEIAEARAAELTQPVSVGSSLPTQVGTPEARPQPRQAKKSKRGPKAKTGPGTQVTAPVPAAADRVPLNSAGAGATLDKAVDRVKAKLLVKIGGFYGSAGLCLRGLLLLAGLMLVFVQKAPRDEPGRPQPKVISQQALRIAAGIGAVIFLVAAYILLTIHHYAPAFIEIGYPGAAATALASGGMIGFLWASTKRVKFGLTTERQKTVTPAAIHFRTKDGGWITIANPYRGTLVLGGAGAGKTYSIGEPLIEQFAYKNFAGLIYDFKFPVLAEVAQRALVLAERKKLVEEEKAAKFAASWLGKTAVWFGFKPKQPEPLVQLHMINFRDLTRSERVNPLRPADMPVVAYAEEYSRAIMANLNPSSIKKMEFFDTSAVAYLTSIIWFYKRHHPQFCTIPHVVATAMYKDYRHVLSMLETDIESGDQARSLISAVETKADKQVGAVLGTLQVNLTRINSPEVVWVLTPDEANGEGFSLNLNDPAAPKLLCLGNDPSLKETFSPIVSGIITVAIKLMNQQHRHRSYVFLDEAATIYVPGLDTLPATGRSNLVATVYMTQGFPQMTDMYGRDKMQVMVDNLNNQFFGKTNSVETAKFISDLVGREDREMTSTSQGKSMGGTGHTNNSSNTSTSYQERNLVRVQDAIKLQQGEFIGQTVETGETFFQGTIFRDDVSKERFPLHPMVTFGGEGADEEASMRAVVQENFLQVRQAVRDVINMYPNTLAGASQ